MAAAQATVPVAQVTRLEDNGAAPSTNTDEIQDTRGKKKAGGGVAMARTIVMAAVATATTRAWSREYRSVFVVARAVGVVGIMEY